MVEQTPGLVRGKLVGIGHSLGAHAMLRAEASRPGTFASLYCFEPIFVCDPGKLPPFVPMSLGVRRRGGGGLSFPVGRPCRVRVETSTEHIAIGGVTRMFDTVSSMPPEVKRARSRWPVRRRRSRRFLRAAASEAEANKLVGGGKVRCPVTVAHGATHDPRDVYGRSPNDAIYSSIISPIIAEYIGENAFVEYARR